MENGMCTCKVFDRDVPEMTKKKCIGPDGCGKPLTKEELDRFDKDGILITKKK